MTETNTEENNRECRDAEHCYRIAQGWLQLYGCRAVLAAFVKLTEDIGAIAEKTSLQVAEDIKKVIRRKKNINKSYQHMLISRTHVHK